MRLINGGNDAVRTITRCVDWVFRGGGGNLRGKPSGGSAHAVPMLGKDNVNVDQRHHESSTRTGCVSRSREGGGCDAGEEGMV